MKEKLYTIKSYTLFYIKRRDKMKENILTLAFTTNNLNK